MKIVEVQHWVERTLSNGQACEKKANEKKAKRNRIGHHTFECYSAHCVCSQLFAAGKRVRKSKQCERIGCFLRRQQRKKKKQKTSQTFKLYYLVISAFHCVSNARCLVGAHVLVYYICVYVCALCSVSKKGFVRSPPGALAILRASTDVDVDNWAQFIRKTATSPP